MESRARRLVFAAVAILFAGGAAGKERTPPRGPRGSGAQREAAIVVSRESLESADPRDVINVNIDFVNALLDAGVPDGAIAAGAMRSYYVDYYLAQVNNGGFSQFVYNSRWNPQLIAFVRDGLREIGAKRNLALFERAAARVNALGKTRLGAFVESGYFGENPPRVQLDERITSEFYELNKVEDLEALNSAWLRSRPNLVVVPESELEEEVRRRAAARALRRSPESP